MAEFAPYSADDPFWSWYQSQGQAAPVAAPLPESLAEYGMLGGLDAAPPVAPVPVPPPIVPVPATKGGTRTGPVAMPTSTPTAPPQLPPHAPLDRTRVIDPINIGLGAAPTTEIAGPSAPDPGMWAPPPLVDPNAWAQAAPIPPANDNAAMPAGLGAAPGAPAGTPLPTDATAAPEPPSPSMLDLLPSAADASYAAQPLGKYNTLDLLPSSEDAAHLAYHAGNVDANTQYDQNVLDDMARNDPEGLLRVTEAHKRIGDEIALKQAADAATKARVQAENNYRAYTDATAKAQAERDQIMAESKRLAATPLDPNRYWANRTTGQKIAGYIQAAIGGLIGVNNRTGVNQGLELIQKEIDRDIEAQKFDIQNRGAELGRRATLVGQAFSQAGDLYRAGEIARAAAYESVIKDIDAQRLAFDPQGTKALALSNLSMQVKQAQAAALQAAQDKAFKNNLDIAKVNQDYDKLASEERRAHEANAVGWGHVAAANRAADATREATAEARAQRLQDKADKAAEKASEDQRKYGLTSDPEVVLDDKGQPVRDATGQPMIRPAQPLLNADGKPWQGRDEKITDAFGTKIAKAKMIADMIDEINAIRDDASFMDKSSWSNSSQYQRLKVLQAQIGNLAKQGTEGMSSDADMERLQESVGADDLTKFRDKSAGLAEARQRTIDALNAEASKRYSYTGKPFSFANRWGSPMTTAEEQEYKDLATKGEPGTFGRWANRASWFIGGPTGFVNRALVGTVDVKTASKLDNVAKSLIDKYSANLQSKDPHVRDLAAARLWSLAGSKGLTGTTTGADNEGAYDEDIRNYAASKIGGIMNMGRSDEPVGPSASVSGYGGDLGTVEERRKALGLPP